jgi:hypothetical protein
MRCPREMPPAGDSAAVRGRCYAAVPVGRYRALRTTPHGTMPCACHRTLVSVRTCLHLAAPCSRTMMLLPPTLEYEPLVAWGHTPCNTKVKIS